MTRFFVAAFCILILAASMAGAATRITSTFSMDMMMFGPGAAQTETTVVWVDGPKMAMEYDSMSMLLDMDAMTAYMIIPDSQEYMSIPLHMDSLLGLVVQQYPQADSIMTFAMSMIGCLVGQFDVTVEDLGETRQIDQFTARHMIMTMSVPILHVTYDMWVDTSLQNYWDMYSAMARKMFGQMPELDALIEKTLQIRGLPVEYAVTFDVVGMPMSMQGQVIDYEEMEPPPGLFELPPDYQEVRFSDELMEGMSAPDSADMESDDTY